jgi:CheY-like chemotaxis protein
MTKPISCLFVDDNSPIYVPFLSRAFNGSHIELTVANSGKSAVVLWNEKQFDVTVMDYQMPEMNGDEATKKILEIYALAWIIGFTSDADNIDVVEKCKAAGMRDVLPKDTAKVVTYIKEKVGKR